MCVSQNHEAAAKSLTDDSPERKSWRRWEVELCPPAVVLQLLLRVQVRGLSIRKSSS